MIDEKKEHPAFLYGRFLLFFLSELGYELSIDKCAICGKGAHFGNNVSHSNRKSNRMWKSNVKSVRCKVNGAAKRMYVCTSCLRSGKVERV